jgi:hypothetical protein
MISGETMIFPVAAKNFRLFYRCLVSEHEYDLGICITMLREGSSFNQKRQQKNSIIINFHFPLSIIACEAITVIYQ